SVSLSSRDLVDADDVQRLPGPVLEPPIDRSLHGRRYRLPVPPEVLGGFFPGELSRKLGQGPGQSPRHSLPLVGPRHVLHARPTGQATNSSRTVAKHQILAADPQAAPFPELVTGVDPSCSTRAVAAAQRTPLEPLDLSDQPTLLLLDRHYPVGFQTETLPDTSLQAHPSRPSFRRLGTPAKDSRVANAPQSFTPLTTLFGEEPN